MTSTDPTPTPRRPFRGVLAGMVTALDPRPAVADTVPVGPARPDLRPAPRPAGAWAAGPSPALTLPDVGRFDVTIDAPPPVLAAAVARVRAEGRPLRISAPPRRVLRVGAFRLYVAWKPRAR